MAIGLFHTEAISITNFSCQMHRQISSFIVTDLFTEPQQCLGQEDPFVKTQLVEIASNDNRIRVSRGVN